MSAEHWIRRLLRVYPADFRDEMGDAVVETYLDRHRAAVARGGAAVAWFWTRALADAARNGVAERLRPAVAWRRNGNWGRDTQRVVRRLVRAPAFALSMLGTLAVGLGAFAVVYTVVDKVLVAPLPYDRPDDLYYVWRNYTWIPLERGWLGGTDVAALQKSGGPIADVAGIRRAMRTLTTSDGADPMEIPILISSPNLFSLLGARPALGRVFAPNEAGEGRPPLVVLGNDLWRTRFGGDRAILGKEIRLDGFAFTVIGVMGPDFRFVRHASLGKPEGGAAYITFNYDLATQNPGNGSFAGLVRARPGTTPERLQAAVASVGRMVNERDFSKRGLKLWAVGVKPDLVAESRPALVVLGMAGVVLVLVLAVNMATLLLVRASQREREFAIARALGADRLALARATLFEGGLLGAVGGALGALGAVWGTRVLVALAPETLPRRDTIAVDWRIAAVVVGVGAVLGLLAGAVPAVWTSRTRLHALLRNAAVRGGGGGHGPMRRAMVVVQVALSLVLLATGGLVARSLDRLLRAQPGFVADGVLTLRVPLAAARYPNDTVVREMHERLQRELSAIPGVRSASATSALPLTANADQGPVSFPGAPGNTGVNDHDFPLVDYMRARAGYFETMGIRVLAGRAFGASWRPGTREAVIDRTLAQTFFPNGQPVGARIRLSDTDTFTVIGVVEHARQYDVYQDGRSQVYVRDEDGPFNTLSYVLRGDRAPEALVPDVRAAVHRVDAQLAIADVRPMQRVVDDALRQQRLSATLIAGFSLGALLLAAMGLFGVVAGAVSRRHHELAVRLALGAGERRVLWLVVREGTTLLVLGLLVGVPGIWLAGTALRGALVGVSPFDPLTLGAVAAGLGVVALAACYVPARRVAGIAPARALRDS
ncbi:permease [Gemmatirosa kalamazoonensis]|uniref:Permease n=1 Tax=Gemmatirosa kalamazoonensis TaxID=861299 RepID=W0RH63_9BACT|nr:ADOP family duplicated permease [Gemmatirosa kalamazoonensis]AHG89752.1 permease [Gemmatirosa kalamazoonensis]